MAVEAVPTPALEVAEAAELLAVLVELLDRLAGPDGRHQLFQRRLSWQVAEVVLRLAFAVSARQALGDQPAPGNPTSTC